MPAVVHSYSTERRISQLRQMCCIELASKSGRDDDRFHTKLSLDNRRSLSKGGSLGHQPRHHYTVHHCAFICEHGTVGRWSVVSAPGHGEKSFVITHVPLVCENHQSSEDLLRLSSTDQQQPLPRRPGCKSYSQPSGPSHTPMALLGVLRCSIESRC